MQQEMDPHLVTTRNQTPQPEIAHVLFLDVVGYGKLKRMRDLLGVSYQLTDIVRNTAEYRLKDGSHTVICRPVGDGMALVFFDDPAAPIRCAVEIAHNVRRQASIHLRMGIHSGPVFRHPDICEQPDVTGPGIIIAQRIMDCGDANHILLSRAMAEILLALGDWNECISIVGPMKDKHGLPLFVYNFSNKEVGNSNPPTKRISEAETKPLVQSVGQSLGRDESTKEIKTETFGRLREPLRGTPRINCNKCGMSLYHNSKSCRHCGHNNA